MKHLKRLRLIFQVQDFFLLQLLSTSFPSKQQLACKHYAGTEQSNPQKVEGKAELRSFKRFRTALCFELLNRLVKYDRVLSVVVPLVDESSVLHFIDHSIEV